jgi:hypothetical protein
VRLKGVIGVRQDDEYRESFGVVIEITEKERFEAQDVRPTVGDGRFHVGERLGCSRTTS